VVFDSSMEFDRGIMEVVNQDSEMSYTAVREIPADLAAVGRTLVDAFGVRERYFHFEFFREPDGGLKALEVNLRPPGGYTMDMWNYQNDIDMYRAYGDLLVEGRIGAVAHRPYFVTWIGRKDRFQYAWSGAALRRRFGDLIVHQARVEDVFARAIGNEGFILRSPDLDPLVEAEAAIRERA
jgi:hypothetical protein